MNSAGVEEWLEKIEANLPAKAEKPQLAFLMGQKTSTIPVLVEVFTIPLPAQAG